DTLRLQAPGEDLVTAQFRHLGISSFASFRHSCGCRNPELPVTSATDWFALARRRQLGTAGDRTMIAPHRQIPSVSTAMVYDNHAGRLRATISYGPINPLSKSMRKFAPRSIMPGPMVTCRPSGGSGSPG